MVPLCAIAAGKYGAAQLLIVYGSWQDTITVHKLTAF